MQRDQQYAPVLAEYPDDCRPRHVEYLDSAGGFSGARFWRVDSARGPLCLRRWPREHPTCERLQFIQAVLWHVHQEGFNQLPLPLETRTHAGYVQQADHLWEVTPWMPGAADYHLAPTPEKLAAAMTALARFHRAAASFPLPMASTEKPLGIAHRAERLQALLSGEFDKLAAAVDAAPTSPLQPAARRIVRLFARPAPAVLQILESCRHLEVPAQPCIRDIWSDHVLFVGADVSSLIDFGAMRPDTVAADVARLLGSLAGDDADVWGRGLEAYDAVRPLADAEGLLITAMDQSSVLMSGLNWIEWLFVQQRQFADMPAVATRLNGILARLEHLSQRACP